MNTLVTTSLNWSSWGATLREAFDYETPLVQRIIQSFRNDGIKVQIQPFRPAVSPVSRKSRPLPSAARSQADPVRPMHSQPAPSCTPRRAWGPHIA